LQSGARARVRPGAPAASCCIIQNKKPDFDSRNYAYKKLSELLDASSYFEAKPINNVGGVLAVRQAISA
jgi:hypothetical protein